MAAERIFIVGPSGSGKTTLAAQVAELTGLPVHHLDAIARVGGGRGPATSSAECASAVAQIVATGRWIAEGVQLGWTAPLFEAADAIVWLDHVTWRRSSGRVLRRFVSGALGEARRRRGRERFLRVRDYARRLRELAVSLPDTRTYPAAEVAQAVAGYQAKTVRCRAHADVDEFVRSLSGAPRNPDPVPLRRSHL